MRRNAITSEVKEENDEINLRRLPEMPQGYVNNGVEVLIKIKKQF